MKKTLLKETRSGFTLIELLVVIAIIAILASILFPVFGAVKNAARKAACLSNAKQVGLAIVMYNADSDDMMVPADTGGTYPTVNGWGLGHPDHVWGELIEPYTKSWNILRCPMDPNANDQTLAADPWSNQPLAKGAENYYYSWAERADYGLNYDFLTPWVYDPAHGRIGSQPISLSMSTHPAMTIATIDSVWDRNAQTGAAFGGGNWVVEAPCVYSSTGQFLPSIDPSIWFNYGGWQPNTQGKAPFSWLEFGGAWPRHANQFNANYLDGHAKTATLAQIVTGCTVAAHFGGDVTDTNTYPWGL
jgi:prepilin-type N-terminal cleavage/methylation domain-containing protein/prepilin-type processing-associated H-X9-DG protein